MKRFENFKYLDSITLILVSLLVLSGTIMIGSANGWVYDSQNFQLDSLMTKQLFGFGIGVIIVSVIMLCDFKFIKFMSWPIYAVVLILLVLVLRFGIGAFEGDEVRRWLDFGAFTVQPSELEKIALVLVMSWFLAKFQEKINHPLYLLIVFTIAGIPLFLVLKEPDLSTSVVITSIIVCLLFTAKISWKYVVVGIIAVTLLVLLIVYDINSESFNLLSAYQMNRILAWIHPEDYALTTAYQTMQARQAIGIGGLRGVGLFNNSGMVPIPTTDFIFAIIGEELGFIGACYFIILIMALTFRILWISTQTRDFFGKLICVGMAAMIGVQSAIHMGVNTALLPNTGLPLPFVSYGLSSLVANMVGIGLVLRIRAENEKQSKGGHYEYRINR